MAKVMGKGKKGAEKFKDRLKTAMAAKGMTQAGLVLASGIGKSSVSMYASGLHEPKDPHLRALAKALCVTKAYLAGHGPAPGEVPEPESGIPFSKVPVRDAAKMIGMSQKFVQAGLRQGTLHIGSAVRSAGKKHIFHVSPALLQGYMGAERFNRFYGVRAPRKRRKPAGRRRAPGRGRKAARWDAAQMREMLTEYAKMKGGLAEWAPQRKESSVT
jgi:hypothetical protein